MHSATGESRRRESASSVAGRAVGVGQTRGAVRRNAELPVLRDRTMGPACRAVAVRHVLEPAPRPVGEHVAAGRQVVHVRGRALPESVRVVRAGRAVGEAPRPAAGTSRFRVWPRRSDRCSTALDARRVVPFVDVANRVLDVGATVPPDCPDASGRRWAPRRNGRATGHCQVEADGRSRRAEQSRRLPVANRSATAVRRLGWLRVPRRTMRPLHRRVPGTFEMLNRPWHSAALWPRS